MPGNKSYQTTRVHWFRPWRDNSGKIIYSFLEKSCGLYTNALVSRIGKRWSWSVTFFPTMQCLKGSERTLVEAKASAEKVFLAILNTKVKLGSV